MIAFVLLCNVFVDGEGWGLYCVTGRVSYLFLVLMRKGFGMGVGLHVFFAMCL